MKVIIIAAIIVVIIKVSSAATGIKVGPVRIERTDKGICTCNGVEIKDKRIQREFRVMCVITKMVKEKQGKKEKLVQKTVWHTSCIYGGEPHKCGDYNKNQQKFYEGLLSVTSKDYCDDPEDKLVDGACKHKTYNADTICEDVDFTFNRS